jgi:hypothetical protein
LCAALRRFTPGFYCSISASGAKKAKSKWHWATSPACKNIEIFIEIRPAFLSIADPSTEIISYAPG